MTDTRSREEIVKRIRHEIGKYAERPFGDHDDLVRDVHLVGDDLTAAALSIEQSLGVSIDRSRYRLIRSVNDLADAMHGALRSNV